MKAPAVHLISKLGKWIVRVVEGETTHDRDFEHEQHAMSWAHGQRIRLKLPEIIFSSEE